MKSRLGLAWLLLLSGFLALGAAEEDLSSAARGPAYVPVPGPNNKSRSRLMIARVWQARTPADKSDEYNNYLNQEVIRKIEAMPGNQGVQVIRTVNGNVADFQVTSYWFGEDELRRAPGDPLEKPRTLTKDYLLGSLLKDYDVLTNDWKGWTVGFN